MKKLEIFLTILFFFSIVFSLLQPVYDPDAFWHLKAGQWILDHGQIPEKDPFAYTTGADSLRSRSILRSYWLSEVLIAGLYRLTGLFGIVLFRLLVYLSILIFLFYHARRNGLDVLTSTVLLFPIGLIAIYYLGGRPNILTYLYSVILMGLLFDLRDKRTGGYSPSVMQMTMLPLVMLLWSNSHGGYILGIVMLAAFGAEEVLTMARGTSGIRNVLLCLFSIVVTVLNPNGWNSILSLSGNLSTRYLSYIGEWQGLLDFLAGGSILPLTVFLFSVAVALWNIKRYGIYEVLLFLFLGFIGFRSIRFLPFLAFFAFFSLLIYRGGALKAFMNRMGIRHAALCLLPVVFTFLMWHYYPFSLFKDDVVPERYPLSYPRRAAEFIEEAGIGGNMFNYFEYGGYLIYALWPDYRVFVDTRAIDLSVFDEYMKVMKGLEGGNTTPGRTHIWESILDKYGVDFVIVPSVHTVTGSFIPLVYRLVNDSGWSLIYSDSITLIFVRNVPENTGIIKRYGLPGNIAYANAYDQIRAYALMYGPEWRQYLTMGRVAVYDHRRNDAISLFRKAVELNPSLMGKDAGKALRMLESGKDMDALADEMFYLNVEDFHLH